MITVTATLVCAGAAAQNGDARGENNGSGTAGDNENGIGACEGVGVENVRIERIGEVVHIDMDITLRDVELGSAAALDIIPVLTAGGHETALPHIALKGPSEHRAHERRQSLAAARQNVTPYYTGKGRRWEGRVIEYRHIVRYEPWMEDASVVLVGAKGGCGTTGQSYAAYLGKVRSVETPHVPAYAVVLHPAYIQPVAGEVKQREKEAEVSLDFAVDKYDIRPDYMNNPRELAKIYAILDGLRNDPDISVKRMDIIGFASPEGSLRHNKWLSERRATALRDYLFSLYDFPRDIYRIVFGGENWDGLTTALRAENIPYKDEIMAVIDGYTVEQNRESRLMALRGGEPYRYLLRNVFPRLRVARCRIEYEIRAFTAEEARELVGREPQKLNLNEMFLAARSCEEGSHEFDEIFETAVRMYPDNEIAILNAAAAALKRNDAVSAERYLERISDPAYPAEYYNSIGLLMLLRGDRDGAKEYLDAAAGLGLEAARLNLDELKKQ